MKNLEKIYDITDRHIISAFGLLFLTIMCGLVFYLSGSSLDEIKVSTLLGTGIGAMASIVINARTKYKRA